MLTSLLPVVREDIRHSIHREMERDPNYLNKVFDCVTATNPVVAAFAIWIADRYDDEQVSNDFIKACMMVYRLLESQAEADTLISGRPI